MASRDRTPDRVLAEQRGNRSGRRRSQLTPYAFILPAMMLFGLTFVLPLIYAIYLSLHSRRVVTGAAFGQPEEVFVGLDNYVETFRDSELFSSLQRLVVYAVIVIPVTLGLALIAALLLDLPRQPLVKFARTALLLPYAVPGVVAAVLWGFLYLPGTSPANYVAKSLGAPTLNFLEAPQMFGALANIAIWGALGFNMIIMYTSLRAIPDEIYEAARVDGCSEVAIAIHIKLPLLVPSLFLAALFSTIGTLQVYSEPMILRSITSNISSTFFPLMTVYRDAFYADDNYKASATAVVLALAVLFVSGLILNGAVRQRSSSTKGNVH